MLFGSYSYTSMRIGELLTLEISHSRDGGELSEGGSPISSDDFRPRAWRLEEPVHPKWRSSSSSCSLNALPGFLSSPFPLTGGFQFILPESAEMSCLPGCTGWLTILPCVSLGALLIPVLQNFPHIWSCLPGLWASWRLYSPFCA